jgi:hypothetical protein
MTLVPAVRAMAPSHQELLTVGPAIFGVAGVPLVDDILPMYCD